MLAATVFSTSDTIVAIATPPGRGGIGVVRLSGAEAHRVARRLITSCAPLELRRETLKSVRAHAKDAAQSAHGESIDPVVVTYFPAPHSYTGDDVVELSAHGSPVVLGAIVSSCLQSGARLAQPGEFTLRA